MAPGVRILVGAEAAYACIKTETRSLDVRLMPGKAPTTSLRETAAELRQQAQQLHQRAALIESAATALADMPLS